MDWFLIVAWACAIVGIGSYFGLPVLKNLPVKKKTGSVLALIGIVGLAWMYNVGGVQEWFEAEEEAIVTPPTAPTGFIFDATISESDANLTLDGNTVTMRYYENTTGTKAQDGSGNDIDNVTFTITLWRLDTLGETDATTSLTSAVGWFRVAGDSTDYSIVNETTAGGVTEWDVQMTPSGGSMRRESVIALVTPGSSTDISVTVVLDHTGLCALDNYQSKSITITAPDVPETFTLRCLKIGEQA